MFRTALRALICVKSFYLLCFSSKSVMRDFSVMFSEGKSSPLISSSYLPNSDDSFTLLLEHTLIKYVHWEMLWIKCT